MVYYKTKYSAKGSSLSSLNYRFGYQGSEKDNEVNSSNGTSYTTEFRQLDTRLGRWFSSDPVFQPWQSSYTSMDNNPINLTDVLGDISDKGKIPENKKRTVGKNTGEKDKKAPEKPSEKSFEQKKTEAKNQKQEKRAQEKKEQEKEVNKEEEEKTKAHAVIDIFENKENTNSVFDNIPKSEIIADLRERVNSGGNQITQSENTCGIAAIAKLFCESDPLGYVNFTLNLYQYGIASHNNYTIDASENISYWSKNAISLNNGNHGVLKGADLVLIGSLRYVENSPNGFNNSGLSGFTTPSEVNSLVVNLLGFREINANSSVDWKIRKASEMMGDGQSVYSLYLYPVGGGGYHYQVFKGLNPTDSQKILFWDYGSTTYRSKPKSNIIGFGSRFWILIPQEK